MGIDVYSFIIGVNQIDEMRVRIFDTNSERCIFNEVGELDDNNIVYDLEIKGLDGYEVLSVDMFWCEDEKRICCELNIEVDDDEVDNFEEVI